MKDGATVPLERTATPVELDSVYGALSDLPYTIQVTDTLNGAVKSYQSTAGKLCGGLDNTAFAP